MAENFKKRGYWCKPATTPRPDVDEQQDTKPDGVSDSKKSAGSKPKRLPKNPPPDAFTPRASSTTTTHLRNDPLINQSVLIEGLTTTAPSPKIPFHLDTSRFFSIVRNVYLYLTRGKQIKARISQSFFEYYSVILLWRRVFYVLSEEERDRTASEVFDAALPANIAIPEELGRYLDGIGNFKDHAGRDSVLRLFGKLKSTLVKEISGHYGKVDADTHVLYETMPAPFVSVHRMAYKYALYKHAKWDTSSTPRRTRPQHNRQ